MKEQHKENINKSLATKTTLEDIKDDWLLNYNREIVKIASLIEMNIKNI